MQQQSPLRGAYGQCCTRVENSHRASRSRENISVSKGLVRLAKSRFTRSVASARSAAREYRAVAESAPVRRLFWTAFLTVWGCAAGNR
jgi:hypothetical protein